MATSRQTHVHNAAILAELLSHASYHNAHQPLTRNQKTFLQQLPFVKKYTFFERASLCPYNDHKTVAQTPKHTTKSQIS